MMAKPIEQTPVLEGEDAIRFLKILEKTNKRVELTKGEKRIKNMLEVKQMDKWKDVHLGKIFRNKFTGQRARFISRADDPSVNLQHTSLASNINFGFTIGSKIDSEWELPEKVEQCIKIKGGGLRCFRKAFHPGDCEMFTLEEAKAIKRQTKLIEEGNVEMVNLEDL